MMIIELNEEQFRSYANFHSNRNYFQTVEFANMYELYGYKKLYVGLVDDNNNLIAASLLLLNKIKNYKYAYAPRGFLIDYNDMELFKTFTIMLKNYLKRIKVVFVKVDPRFVYKKYDKDLNVINDNSKMIPFLESLDYVHLGFNTYFESINSRFEVISTDFGSIKEAYDSLSRNVKRSIIENNKMGISIHEGDASNIDLFYNIIKKKTKNNLVYFKNYFKCFNTQDNKIELYFAKINTETYVNNYRYLVNKETKNNNLINGKMQDINSYKSKNLLDKKILSDHLLQEYNNKLVDAINLYKNYPNGLIVGTCAVIVNNKEVYFLMDGYVPELKEIHTSYSLKWEIIKKYINLGYKVFNLGEITGNFSSENNKYYGLFFSKMGFNSYVYEYPGEFDLVVNKFMYKLYYNVMHYESKRKNKKNTK
ncbi:MAG: aminoacyltransferase [Tenericutes bacterium]|nr:aminoacyltransferase [Mycoplasmatota bacterium]